MPCRSCAPRALALLASLVLVPEGRAQPRCTAPSADLVRGTLGGLSLRATPAQIRARMPCLRPSDAVPGLVEAPRTAAEPVDAPFAFEPGGWSIYQGFEGTVRPAVLGVPVRTALARLRASGVRVFAPLGDTDNAFLLRTRYGCLALFADESGRVDRLDASSRACASP